MSNTTVVLGEPGSIETELRKKFNYILANWSLLASKLGDREMDAGDFFQIIDEHRETESYDVKESLGRASFRILQSLVEDKQFIAEAEKIYNRLYP